MDDASMIRLIETHYDTFWNGDLDDFELELSAGFCDAGSDAPAGPGPVKDAARAARAAFSDMKVIVDDAIVAGPWVAVRATWSGTHDGPYGDITPSGRPVTFSGLVVWTIDDNGKISGRHEFLDREALMARLGGAA